MGYGAFMRVTNNRKTDIQLFVTNVQCMYDNGEEGSNLSLFNNAIVPASQALPVPGGNGQYIEVKASGGCFFETSTFNLKVEDVVNHVEIGEADFSEDDENWSLADNTNKDVIDVMINNSGDQAQIAITVEAT
jgi:hypothetical protein